MANDNTARDVDRVWELMKTIGSAMLVTIDGDRLRAQPVSACLERDQDDAEFRDEPGSVISHVKMAAASVTGMPPQLGDNRKVAM